MGMVLPALFHWSPTANREKIKRRGLRPLTFTAAFTDAIKEDIGAGHYVDFVEPIELKMVCLGTSPLTAWNYSGAYGELGESWDLWEVILDEDDHVYPHAFKGCWLEEVRVYGNIPKSRVQYAGSRTVEKYRKRRQIVPNRMEYRQGDRNAG